jgi:hypothetical protein
MAQEFVASQKNDSWKDRASAGRPCFNGQSWVLTMLGFLALFLLNSTPVEARLLLYSSLATKDLDQMRAIVNQKITKAQDLIREGQEQASELATDEGELSLEETVQDREAIELLREAVKIIMARPDIDNMVAALIERPRKELRAFQAYESTLESLVDEALAALKNKSLKPPYKATYLVILKNLMAELNSQIQHKPEKIKVFERIAKSKVKVSSELANELRMRSMLTSFDPVKAAEKVLKDQGRPLKK